MKQFSGKLALAYINLGVEHGPVGAGGPSRWTGEA